MKLTLLALAASLFSFNSFATDLMLSKLSCSVRADRATQAEKSFKLEINFNQNINAATLTAFPIDLTADIAITTGTRIIEVDQVNMKQQTKTYGRELHTGEKILDSEAYTIILLKPEIQKYSASGPQLINYSGEIEINGLVDDVDTTIIHSKFFVCVPN